MLDAEKRREEHGFVLLHLKRKGKERKDERSLLFTLLRFAFVMELDVYGVRAFYYYSTLKMISLDTITAGRGGGVEQSSLKQKKKNDDASPNRMLHVMSSRSLTHSRTIDNLPQTPFSHRLDGK